MALLDQEISTESTATAKSNQWQRRKTGKSSATSSVSPVNTDPTTRKLLPLSKLSLRRKFHVIDGTSRPLSVVDPDAATATSSTTTTVDVASFQTSSQLSTLVDHGTTSRRRKKKNQEGENVDLDHPTTTRKSSFLRGLGRKAFGKDGGSHESERTLQEECVSILNQTKIVAELGTSPTTKIQESTNSEERQDLQERIPAFSCATAILEHHFLERLCGTNTNASFSDIHSGNAPTFPEDPTVQESIECIFAAQLEDGLDIWDEEQQETIESRNPDEMLSKMVSPSVIQQSRQNRSDRLAVSLSQTKKRYEQASLVYMGTFDPTISQSELSGKDSQDGPLQCCCQRSYLPPLGPEDWPQAPILLRPTPGQGMKIKGIRVGNEKDYIWEPGSHMSWSQSLAQRWGVPYKAEPRVACCEECAVLPINNGNELENEALSIDFESELFVGTLLLRIRHSEGTTKSPYNDNKGYFHGLNRRYQAVIRGRFKKSLPFFELNTGFQFPRACGRLPAKWILRGGIKVLSFFAPQLDCKMEGDRPHSLTPLGSTPQVICVDDEDTLTSIAAPQVEPKEDHRSLLGYASPSPSSIQRARGRKKAYDKLFVQKSNEPRTDPSKIYTFEFLQHLFNFQEFSIELGNMLGSVDLKDLLDGQPLQIMAAHGEQSLWSFDIWHERLWEDAQKYEKSHTS